MPRTIELPTRPGLLHRLADGPILGAEGYVFELERRGYIRAGAYVPEVVLDHPEALLELHREFADAGSEVMPALTYYGHRRKLADVGREDDIEALNRAAVRIARQAAAESGALVAADVSNSWVYDPSDPAAIRATYRQYAEQLAWAADEGVDFAIAETHEYLGEALLALKAIRELGLPALVSFTPIYEQSKDDVDWITAARTLADSGADVVGFNCGRSFRTMRRLLASLRATTSAYIAAVPVPYRTTAEAPAFQFLREPDGSLAYTLSLEHFLYSRREVADDTTGLLDVGVNYLGLCCGNAPHYTRAMAEQMGRRVPSSRFSPDISQHSLLGSAAYVNSSERRFLRHWRNPCLESTTRAVG